MVLFLLLFFFLNQIKSVSQAFCLELVDNPSHSAVDQDQIFLIFFFWSLRLCKILLSLQFDFIKFTHNGVHDQHPP